MGGRNSVKFSIQTNDPIAVDSLDHTHPCGAMRDCSANPWFNQALRRYYGRPFRTLDIGCAGGCFVKSLLDEGMEAVGIEGSDYMRENSLFHWPELDGKNLFTCDATKYFDILSDGRGCSFDVVTAWEVLEHIKMSDLEAFLHNVKNHLMPDGLFICSISSVDSPHTYNGENVDLHRTIMPHEHWIEWMERAGFIQRVDIADALGHDRVRYGTMTHIGSQQPENETGYEGFHYGNYVFTKAQV